VSEEARYLAHRESFRVAEAVLAAVRRQCPAYTDEDAVWQAFVAWSGKSKADYLRGIRSSGNLIFYGVLQDLYDFAARACHDDVTVPSGERLAEALLEQHMPDILQSTLFRAGTLREKLQWLVSRFFAGATGEVYRLVFEPRPEEGQLQISVAYMHEAEIAEHLRRSGHNPERAFANSFGVMRGALLALAMRTVHGFQPEQFECELRGLSGTFILRLTERNRFHYENFIAILLDYVRKLYERKELADKADLTGADFPRSALMQQTLVSIRKAAASDETVLLRGESGTGKSYYARAIHDTSARRSGPFVEVGLTSDVGTENLIQSNLFGHVRGAFTGADEEKQGLFALADGGTIFLDEIGDASPDMQAKLLRVLEKKSFKMLGGTRDITVDVRVIGATNKDIEGMVAENRFRQDLYYRIEVIDIVLPPLRERTEDVPALVRALFAKVCREAGRQDKRLSDDAFRALCGFGWPGNIRQLENALRHAVAFSEGMTVGVADLPEAIRSAAHVSGPESGRAVVDADALERVLSATAPPSGRPPFEWEGHVDYARRKYLQALIRHHRGNLRKIAEHWDKSSENTLLKLVRQFGLEQELRVARKAGQ